MLVLVIVLFFAVAAMCHRQIHDYSCMTVHTVIRTLLRDSVSIMNVVNPFAVMTFCIVSSTITKGLMVPVVIHLPSFEFSCFGVCVCSACVFVLSVLDSLLLVITPVRRESC